MKIAYIDRNYAHLCAAKKTLRVSLSFSLFFITTTNNVVFIFFYWCIFHEFLYLVFCKITVEIAFVFLSSYNLPIDMSSRMNELTDNKLFIKNFVIKKLSNVLVVEQNCFSFYLLLIFLTFHLDMNSLSVFVFTKR